MMWSRIRGECRGWRCSAVNALILGLPSIPALGEQSRLRSRIGRQRCSLAPIGPASIFLVPAGAVGAGLVEQSLPDIFSRRHAAHKTGQHPLSEFRQCGNSASTRRAAHGAEFPTAEVAGLAARVFRRREDRPRPRPIVHSARDRLAPGPASRDPADARPPAPAFPSGGGTAFASLRVAHSS
jgi:hypothetical protein